MLKEGDKVVFIYPGSTTLIFKRGGIYSIDRITSTEFGDVFCQVQGIHFCMTGVSPHFKPHFKPNLQFRDYFKSLKEIRKQKLLKLNLF